MVIDSIIGKSGVYAYSTPEDAEPDVGQWSVRIDWCEQNCKGNWRYGGLGDFVFYWEPDYITFLLRWT